MPSCDFCGETGTSSWSTKRHSKTLIPVSLGYFGCPECGRNCCSYCVQVKGFQKRFCPHCGTRTGSYDIKRKNERTAKSAKKWGNFFNSFASSIWRLIKAIFALLFSKFMPRKKEKIECCYYINGSPDKGFYGRFEDLNEYTFEVVGPYDSVKSAMKQLKRVTQAASLQHERIYLVTKFNFFPENIKINTKKLKFYPRGNLNQFSDIGKIPKNVGEEFEDIFNTTDNR